MAILQPTLEFTVRTNLGVLLDSTLVDGFFLRFFGHPGYSSGTGGSSTKVVREGVRESRSWGQEATLQRGCGGAL